MSYYFLSLSFDAPHPTPTWTTPPHPTPPLHDPPQPTPSWPTPPHPTPSWPTPPTPSWPTPPHPTPSWPTHHTPPHPWYIFGHKGAFFHGLLHYVSLSVDNENLHEHFLYKCFDWICFRNVHTGHLSWYWFFFCFFVFFFWENQVARSRNVQDQ